MNKLKETLSAVWKAARYSFAFCLRNNKRDTIIVWALLFVQTLLGYGMILLMGKLISVVQFHLSEANHGVMSVSNFLKGGACFPIILFIVALFLEIIIQKYKSFIASRQRHVLRVANTQEMNKLRASLDIARKRSKLYDDIEKKVDELPDGWYTRIAFAGETMEFGGAFLGFTIFGISLLTKHPGYVLILMASSIPMVFAEFVAVSRSWKWAMELIPHHKRRGVLQQAFSGTTSFLQGVMFNQLPTLSVQIKENHDYVIGTMDKLRWSNLKITLGAYVIAMAGLSLVLMHSVYNTISIGGDIGVLTIIVASARRFQSSIRDIVLQIANQWQSVKGMIIIEEEYFGMKPMLETSNPIAPTFKSAPMIRFENVSFSYPDCDSKVLKNVSFTVEPGSKLVIIGKNGSGKSSLIGLMLRHYDPTEGDIMVGDLNLRSIAPANWSEYASALLQNFAIFDRQIGTEIASSRLDRPVDMDGVVKAATFAGFNTVVGEDPKGYNSQIGTEFGGREFSGGEEQRLALARTRYRNTPILILDEPDAKLDPEAAKNLIDNVFALKGVTVIIVTQHVSRAAHGDKIVVLDHGEVVGTGTHSELMSSNARYAAMFTKDQERLGNIGNS
ncbi:MAG: ABC transporter ATP-binding protein [Candidatus Taylorbacteria bacterium]